MTRLGVSRDTNLSSLNRIARYRAPLANVALMYSAAIWGSTFFLVKIALGDINPVILVGYRFTLASLIVAAFLVIKRKPLLTNPGCGITVGFLLWILYVPQTIGLLYTTASNSAFITGLFVLFVPIFSFLLFKRRPGVRDLTAVVVSLGGLWLLTGGLVGANAGDLLTLITAMAYAVHILIVDKYIKRGIDPYVMAFQQFLFVGLASLAAGALSRAPFSIGSAGTLWIVVFLTLFPTFSAFVIQMVAQRIVTPVRVSLIFTLEPVFAALFAWTIGGEMFASMRAAGGLLIVAAMVISAIPEGRFRPARTHP